MKSAKLRGGYDEAPGLGGEPALAVPYLGMSRNQSEFPAKTELKAPEVVAYVATLLKSGYDAEVKTPTGMWRSVTVVYSDGTFGTTRPRAAGFGGRLTILRADEIISVRPIYPVIDPSEGCPPNPR